MRKRKNCGTQEKRKRRENIGKCGKRKNCGKQEKRKRRESSGKHEKRQKKKPAKIAKNAKKKTRFAVLKNAQIHQNSITILIFKSKKKGNRRVLILSTADF